MKPQFCVQSDEIRWLEFLEGQLPPSEALAFEEHVTVCPECNAFCQQWRQLDTELESAVPRPGLSPDFAARLRAKVGQQPVTRSTSVTAQQRQQLEMELQATWVQRRRQLLLAGWPELLDGLGYGVLAAMGGYLLMHFLLTTVVQNLAQPAHSVILGVPAGLGAGAVLLLGTLWFAGRNQFARLLQRI